ncbi:hypothetical protein ACQKDS_09020 [Serratia sp. NPDC078593]|uniref:hypothetical protein n=1 Tax=unclassified Serratia (in: enterobacteria) TaxID=2647522 RepID=UPI0037D22FB1
MRELSKVEMHEVSGAGFLSDMFGSLSGGLFGGIGKDMNNAGNTIIGSITNGFISGAKVFTDFVFNVVKGFNEGRYL